MPTSSRQHEHARRIAPFIWQTMNERGIHSRRVDVDAALQELDAEQIQSIEDAVRLLAKGGDSSSAFEVLADFRLVSRGELRAALKAEGIVWWADALLRVCRASESRAEFAARAAVLLQHPPRPEPGPRPGQEQAGAAGSPARAEAVATLRALCGDLAPDSPSLPEPAETKDSAGSAAAAELAKALESAQVPHSPARPARARAPAARHQALSHQAAHQAHRAVVATSTGALSLAIAALPGEDPRSTLVVEAAQAAGKGFDWATKISMQLDVQDLPQVLALLMGWLQDLVVARDGRTLVFTRHAVGIRCELGDGEQVVRVTIAEGDRYALSMLALSALALNEPVLDGAAILGVVREWAVGLSLREA